MIKPSAGGSMAKLSIEHAHALSKEEAKKRLQTLSDKLASKYGVDARWTSDSESQLKGTGFSGKITCGEGKVSILLDLSFMLSPMKGKIEERIREELRSTLA
jgi:putative polyhydroxyalkanoate system protein